ncbi:MAG: hypothetical protein ACHQPI_11415 [Thermoanaerobaculia bacterium]
MRSPGKWLAIAACAALLAITGAPALADDVVVFDATQQVRIGSLVLEPGTYLIRSSFSMENRNVLTVWSRDEEKFFGYVLATYASSSKPKSPTDQLVFDGADGRTIREWIVAWKGSGYAFSPAKVSPALAARGKAGSAVAAR